MRRKGDLSTTFIITGVVAVFILLVVFTGVWQKYSFFIWVAGLFPGFNQSIPEGTSIIGLNLNNNDLMYFTGEKWSKIDMKQDKVVMGSYDFNPQKIKGSLSSFYFSTKRKPDTLNLEVNHWRYWNVAMGGTLDRTLIITSSIKKGFSGPMAEAQYITLNGLNEVSYPYHSLNSPQGYYPPNFAKIDLESNPSMLAEAIAWRDSILEGNKCEGFLSLESLNENKQASSKKYTVRKEGQYIFVDLGKPVYDGKEESYKDGCLKGILNYVDTEDRSKWKNNANVGFYYLNLDGYYFYYGVLDVFGGYLFEKLLYSANDGWGYFASSSKVDGDNYYYFANKVDDLNKIPEVYRVLSKRNLYDGLILLSKLEGIFAQKDVIFNVFGTIPPADLGVKVNGFGVDISFLGNEKEWGEWENSNEKIDRFIYNVLNEYNKHFLPSVSNNDGVPVP